MTQRHRNMVLGFGRNNIILVLAIFAQLIFLSKVYSQDSTKVINALKKMKKDSVLVDTTKIQKKLGDTLKTKKSLEGVDLDSINYDPEVDGDDLLDDKYILKPSEEDTSNMIRLPVNVKKSRYAYFDASQSTDRVILNNAFQVGEKLEFIIRYGIITAGSATMAIPEIVKVRNNEAFRIETEARSSAFFSAFFKVRDRVESYMDRDGLFTWYFKKELREGGYRSKRYVDYDQVNGWAVTNKKDSLRIPPCVQDVLSSFYYIRTLNLEVGKSEFIDNHADNKLYPLEVKVLKKDKIKVKAGEFDCIVVEPILRASGLFKSKGRLLVWLTDDERKIPVQMKSKILIGYITAELKKMEGTKKKNHVGLRTN